MGLRSTFPYMGVRLYSPRGRFLNENPGIGRRMKLFERDQHPEQFDHELDDLDSDFMNTNHSYKDVKKELHEHVDRLGHRIVKEKYFRSHTLNFLTHSEKDQIRHLHNSDREEYTIEKLAASFPATEEIIYKIIKAKWQFRDAAQVHKHDQKVQENWNALKEGTVPGIDEKLRKHLMQFAGREITPIDTPEIPKPNLLELPKGEFSNIITSCKNITAPVPAIGDREHRSRMDHKIPQVKYGSNTMVIEKINNHTPMTIELFRDSSGMLQPENSQPTTSPATVSTAHTALGSRTAKVEMTPVPSQFDANKKRFQITERITIPRKLQRPGATYKVDDSYFDDDGEFLYRVPGMSK